MSDVSLSVAVEGVEIKGGGQQTPPSPGYLSLCRLPAGQTGGEVVQYLVPPLEDQVMVRRQEGEQSGHDPSPCPLSPAGPPGPGHQLLTLLHRGAGEDG